MKTEIITLVAIFSLFFCNCSKEDFDDVDKNNETYNNKKTEQAVYFPITVGAKWKYKKTYRTPDERNEFIYVELLSYDAETYTYRLSAKTFYEIIIPYGASDGMHDSIIHENKEQFVLLKNSGSKLLMSDNDGSTWTPCFDTVASSQYYFKSFFIKTQTQSMSCYTERVNDYFIDMLPWNPLGAFDCYYSTAYESSSTSGTLQRTNYEYFSILYGYLEGYSKYYSYTEGWYPYYESKTVTETEHIQLVGYKIGANLKGENVDNIEYSVVYQY